MLSWFTNSRLPGPDDNLTADTQSIPIEYFGTVEISIRTLTGSKKTILLNVAYISILMTNLASEDDVVDHRALLFSLSFFSSDEI